MYTRKEKIWINTGLWRRLPAYVQTTVLAFALCADAEQGLLSCKEEDLLWLRSAKKQKELTRALSWLVAADLAHYCNNRYYLNPTLAHEAKAVKEQLFQEWRGILTIPF